MKLKLQLVIAALLLSISVALASDFVSSNNQSIHVNLSAQPVVWGQTPNMMKIETIVTDCPAVSFCVPYRQEVVLRKK